MEHETAAFHSRQQAVHRGYSVPVSNGMYRSNNNLTPQERQAKVLAAKQRTSAEHADSRDTGNVTGFTRREKEEPKGRARP